MEHFIQETEVKDRRATRSATASLDGKPPATDYNKEAKKLQSIRDKEVIGQVDDYLETHEKELQLLPEDLPSARLVLTGQLKEWRKFDPNFNLFGLPLSKVKVIFQKKEIVVTSREDKQEWEENKTDAMTLQSFTDDLKRQGFSNLEIIQKVIEGAENNSLGLLSGKLAEYKQFVALLDDPELKEDRQQILNVLNNTPMDFNSPSFEHFVYTIYDNTSISERTKEKISKKYNIRPIVTGSDLRQQLQLKNIAIEEHRITAKRIDQQLSDVLTTIQSKQNVLGGLKQQIYHEKDMEKRLELEKEYDDMESALHELQEQQKQLKKDKIKQQEQKPPEYIPLRGVEARLEDGRVKVKLVSGREMYFPIGVDTEITESVNAMLLCGCLDELGISQLLFKGQIRNNRPSYDLLAFTNNILATINLSRASEIITASNIQRLKNYLKCFISPDEKGNAMETFESGLESLGILKDHQLSESRFIEAMAFLHTRNSTDECSYNGLQAYFS